MGFIDLDKNKKDMFKRFLLILVVFTACTFEAPTEFSEKAMKDTFLTLENQPIVFKEILDTYKGKKVLIDVWASWCKDCIVTLPDLKELQKEFPDVVYLFLSLDKSTHRWKKGIKRFNIVGEHYYMKSGWDGDFGEFLNLNWIPRYMVVNENGFVDLFKSTKITDARIVNALKK